MESPTLSSLQQSIATIRFEKKDQERKLKIFTQRIEKSKQIVAAYEEMVSRFEKIMEVLNIESISVKMREQFELAKKVSSKKKHRLFQV
jgi:hypothetical protein